MHARILHSKNNAVHTTWSLLLFFEERVMINDRDNILLFLELNP